MWDASADLCRPRFWDYGVRKIATAMKCSVLPASTNRCHRVVHVLVVAGEKIDACRVGATAEHEEHKSADGQLLIQRFDRDDREPAHGEIR